MILITESFRYPSNQVASSEVIAVKDRDANTVPLTFDDAAGLIPSPLTTDDLGNLDFYIAAGSYDFLVRGLRIPFDAVSGGPGGGDPGVHTHVITDTTGLQTSLNAKASAGTAAALALVLGG